MIKPLNDNILIKFIEEKKEENESKIIIFEKEKNEPIQKAKIIDCGKNSTDMIKNGIEILINKFATVKIKYNDEIYHLVNIDDIVAVL